MKPLFTILIVITAGCNLIENSTRPVGQTTPIQDVSVSDAGEEMGKDVVISPPDMKVEYPETCSDGLKNVTESDFDCGGECRPCFNGRACLDVQDCASGFCEENVCVAEATPKPTCTNGVLDADETEIDCGGNCAPCNIEGEPWWNAEWKRRQEVTFRVGQQSVDVALLITLENPVGTTADQIRFVLNGTLLASEQDQMGSSSFWVLFPALSAGDHALQVYSETSDPTQDVPESPWENSFAIYHVPHLRDAQQNLSAPMSTARAVVGLFNNATDFNGRTHITIEDDANKLNELFPTLSISAWIKPTDGTLQWEIVAARQFSDDFIDDFGIGLNFGKAAACLSSGCMRGVTPLPLNVWSHIAFTYDGTVGLLYVDGKLVSTKNFVRTKSVSSHDLILGGNRNIENDVVNEYFHGTVDELRFYTDVLPPETLLTQFNAHAAGFFTFAAPQNLPD